MPGENQDAESQAAKTDSSSGSAYNMRHEKSSPGSLLAPPSSRSVMSAKRDSSIWHASDYVDNLTSDLVIQLNHSQMGFKDLIDEARVADPEGFEAAKDAVVRRLPPTPNKWSVAPIEDLLRDFHSDVTTGLSSAQVSNNRVLYGENMLKREKATPVWRTFVDQFLNPIVLLLLGAAIVSLSFHEWASGVAILIIVTLNACLATYMEKSAGDALAKLASLAAPRCKVLRDGEFMEIDAIELVPGDIVKLEIGDAVPADLRCFQIAELKTNEAILTGGVACLCVCLCGVAIAYATDCFVFN